MIVVWEKMQDLKMRGNSTITGATYASKEDIDKLLLDILPGVLDEKQRKNKIRNLVYAMSKKDKTIINQGTNRNPKWVRVS